MKWNKAIDEIERGLQRGSIVVRYHRKWARNTNELDRIGDVENVTEYEWKGRTCKAVNIVNGSLDEGNYIIDEVCIYDAQL